MRKNLGLLIATILSITLVTTSSVALAATSSSGLSKDLIYFVFPDRYLNGDKANDAGDGFDPRGTAFFHGGDLRGLTGTCSGTDNGLARIKKLGFTAVWVTPLVVQQRSTSGGAGYHGYWGTDFLNVEPHLGTRDDLLAFSACAKKLNLKLILDVVTNHTGDVIQYADKNAFIPNDLISAKAPSWLNQLSNYHNVGSVNNCWGDGPCSQIGDFFSLDDLATEKPIVFNGWAEVYGKWIKDFGFVGFRVDTARHVDDAFFKNWSPQIHEHAKTAGINDFTIFGEVWDINPINLMNYVRRNRIQTVLDFPFQRTTTQFASGYSDASVLENLFLYDDLYTSSTSTANDLVTFLGNHDMGRAAKVIESSKINRESELLPRTILGHSLLYLTRGIPTVYYGDEVGMTGTGAGNDQFARQDMFETQVTIWKNEKRVGSSPIGNGDSFAATQTHPIANHLKKLAELRSSNPALANGVMQIRYAKGSTLVISKKDVSENREYLVAFNNSSKASTVKIDTATSKGGWRTLLGASQPKIQNQKVTLTIPPLSTVVLRADKLIDKTQFKVGKISIVEDFLTGYYESRLAITSNDLLKVKFIARIAPNQPWIELGSDTNSPFRMYIDPLEFLGKTVEVRAQIVNSKGDQSESKSTKFSIPSP